MDRSLLCCLIWVVSIGGLPLAASAQSSIEDRCRNSTAGLVLGMQTHREIGRENSHGHAQRRPVTPAGATAYRSIGPVP